MEVYLRQERISEIGKMKIFRYIQVMEVYQLLKQLPRTANLSSFASVFICIFRNVDEEPGNIYLLKMHNIVRLGLFN